MTRLLSKVDFSDGYLTATYDKFVTARRTVFGSRGPIDVEVPTLVHEVEVHEAGSPGYDAILEETRKML